MLFAVNDWVSVFQSTLPARGATMDIRTKWIFPDISIHAPRTGSDVYIWRYGRSLSAFQSTLPARGATMLPILYAKHPKISIHAPRTGSDPLMYTYGEPTSDFNPRSPHGERRLISAGTE